MKYIDVIESFVKLAGKIGIFDGWLSRGIFNTLYRKIFVTSIPQQEFSVDDNYMHLKSINTISWILRMKQYFIKIILKFKHF